MREHNVPVPCPSHSGSNRSGLNGGVGCFITVRLLLRTDKSHSWVTLVLVLLLGISTAPAWAQTVQPAIESTTGWDGVYTAEQASRGATVYMTECSKCHREDLFGGGAAPALTGSRFMERWREDSLEGLFSYIKTRMPDGRPGTL